MEHGDAKISISSKDSIRKRSQILAADSQFLSVDLRRNHSDVEILELGKLKHGFEQRLTRGHQKLSAYWRRATGANAASAKRQWFQKKKMKNNCWRVRIHFDLATYRRLGSFWSTLHASECPSSIYRICIHSQFVVPSKRYKFKNQNCGNDILYLCKQKHDDQIEVGLPIAIFNFGRRPS